MRLHINFCLLLGMFIIGQPEISHANSCVPISPPIGAQYAEIPSVETPLGLAVACRYTSNRLTRAGGMAFGVNCPQGYQIKLPGFSIAQMQFGSPPGQIYTGLQITGVSGIQRAMVFIWNRETESPLQLEVTAYCVNENTE